MFRLGRYSIANFSTLFVLASTIYVWTWNFKTCYNTSFTLLKLLQNFCVDLVRTQIISSLHDCDDLLSLQLIYPIYIIFHVNLNLLTFVKVCHYLAQTNAYLYAMSKKNKLCLDYIYKYIPLEMRVATNPCLIVPNADVPIEMAGYNPALHMRKYIIKIIMPHTLKRTRD